MSEPEPILVTKSKEEAQSIRSALVGKFDGLWFCVFVESDEYKIRAYTNWGNILPELDAKQVIEFLGEKAKSPEKISEKPPEKIEN